MLSSLLLGSALLSLGCGSEGETPPAKAPVDLVLISLDTLRRDRLGAFGGTDTTPVLDQWLEESLLLAEHRSCSNWTYPAMACIWTGATPMDLGFLPKNTEPAPDSLETLAELLEAEGRQTTLVGSQFLFDPKTQLVQGFSQVAWDGHWSAEQVTAETLQLAEDLTSPWFLQAHYLDPHLPYTAPPEHERRPDELPETPFDLTDDEVVHAIIEAWKDLDEQSQTALLANVNMLYDAEVRYMDHQIGVLLDGLATRGLLDTALVVFVSDHGEQFYEHDQFEHGSSLYGEETWALAALRGPGVEAGRHTAPTNHVDLVPTILHRLGLTEAPQATGVVVGSAAADRPLYTAFLRQRLTMQGVQIGNDRLLFNWLSGELEQYQLLTDPGELESVYDEEDPTSEALLEALWPEVERLAEVLQTEVPSRN